MQTETVGKIAEWKRNIKMENIEGEILWVTIDEQVKLDKLNKLTKHKTEKSTS